MPIAKMHGPLEIPCVFAEAYYGEHGGLYVPAADKAVMPGKNSASEKWGSQR